MKKLVFLLLVPFFSLAQPSWTVNVWGVRPDSICPGDSMTVLYMVAPDNSQPSNPNVTLSIGSNSVWIGTYNILISRPKEKWPTSSDSVRVMTVKTPTTLPVGNTTVYFKTGLTTGISGSITVKNCSCTISTSFTSVTSDLATTLTAVSVGGNSTTVYYWDFGFGWQQGTTVQSYTFGSAGTYTVGLQAVNYLCNDDYFAPVTVSATPTNTVGIEEYQLDRATPVYFDIYGNRTEKKAGVVLIEQRGTIFRKILIQ